MKTAKWCPAVSVWLLAAILCPKMASVAAAGPSGANSADVLAVMQKVAGWQLAHPSQKAQTDWTQAALYAGMMALGDLSADARYREAMMGVGKNNAWKPGERIYHADDHCVGQMYCEMYALERDPAMIAPLRERFDYILAHPSPNGVEVITKADGVPGGIMRWWWCDALFMGPPAWTRLYAVIGESKYLDFMLREWKATSDFLYNKDEHLYFRDQTYFAKKEVNGKKVFWSRGNGWVMGGLVRVLQILPSDHPERAFFEQQFREMAEAVLKCQQLDGLWRSSLLGPESYPLPEASGSGFFCYALTWGINQGLLDRTRFEPAVLRAWNGLTGVVNAEGKLTHVQPIGADPKHFDPDLSETYGVGAFLLAGSEILRMALLEELPHVTVQISSALNAFRPQEAVELDWAALERKVPGATAKSTAVMDGLAGRWLTTEVLDKKGNGKPDKLVFQTDFLPRQKKAFFVFTGVGRAQLPAPKWAIAAQPMPGQAARTKSPLKVRWQ
jgi:unsaturated rhamnogalacturonyl hydrolase